MFEKVIFNTFSVCSAKSQSLFLVDPTPRFWLFHSICFEDLMFQKESQIIVYYWYLIFPCKSQTSLQALSLSRDAWDSLSTLFYLMCFRSELDTTLSFFIEVSIDTSLMDTSLKYPSSFTVLTSCFIFWLYESCASVFVIFNVIYSNFPFLM